MVRLDFYFVVIEVIDQEVLGVGCHLNVLGDRGKLVVSRADVFVYQNVLAVNLTRKFVHPCPGILLH